MRPIDYALSQYGISEYGNGDNPEVLKYFTDLGLPESMLRDETAWCSAFMNWCCKQAGADYSGKANARSWLNIGERSRMTKAGDIAIFWRENPKSWKGHVGFFVNYSEDKNWIYVLGGNQGNRVCIQKYSVNQLLDIRRV